MDILKQLRGQLIEDLLAVKAEGRGPLTTYKSVVPEDVTPLKDDDGRERRVLRFTISTPDVDRDGDTIAVEGWKLESFNENPVMLWAHNPQELPVGTPIKTWVAAKEQKLKSQVKFQTIDINPKSDLTYKAYKAGLLKATSVGFRPIQYVVNEERRDAWGYPGIDHLEQELLEFSAVPIPSNPRALIELEDKTLGIDHDGFRLWYDWTEQELDGVNTTGLVLDRSSLETTHTILKGKCGLAPLVLVDLGAAKPVAKLKGVISYDSAHSGGTPKADEGEAWNGPQEFAAAEVNDLKVMTAWVDGEEPGLKGSYKLPHHKADKHVLVWRGVAAAMGALLGGRGGVDIPEGDRRGVYNHLKKHYEEFEKEAPEFKTLEELEEAQIDGGTDGGGVAGEDSGDEVIRTVKDLVATVQEFKRGRTLSAANERKLRSAADALLEVLAAVEEIQPVEDTPDDSNKSVNTDEFDLSGLFDNEEGKTEGDSEDDFEVEGIESAHELVLEIKDIVARELVTPLTGKVL